MPQRVSSPVFVGRSQELRELRDAFSVAGPNGPTCVFVGGEAGVGKSRLIAEFVEWSRAAGALPLVGGCLALTDGAVAYAPLIEAIRGLLRHETATKVLSALGRSRHVLARLTPELLTSDEQRLLIQVEEPVPQAAIFEATHHLLDRLGRQQAVVLVLEDLHWGDPPTLDLVNFLARTARSSPALVVGTYRTDELHRRHPLRPLLAELARVPRVQRIALSPFTHGELTQQLAGIVGADLDSRLVEDILDRSEGNAFFAEELLAMARTADGGKLPETLRDVLVSRVHELAHHGQQVLRIASVIGRQVDHQMLERVWDGDGDELIRGLREVVSAQLLVPDSSGMSYRFRHALVQEAVHELLLPPERVGLHAAVATSMAADPDLVPAGEARVAAELAYHWYEAGDALRALPAAIAAGTTAEGMLAPGQAVALYERALELWDRVPDAAQRCGLDRTALLRRAAEAAYAAGMVDRALDHLRHALESVDPAVDPVGVADILSKRARYLSLAGDGDAALEAASEAVRLVPEEPPTTERARVLAELGRLLMVIDRYEEAIDVSGHALEVARIVGARAEEGNALNALGPSLASTGSVDEGVSLLRESLAIAEEVGQAEAIARAYNSLTVTLLLSGRPEAAVTVGLEGSRRMRELGSVDAVSAMFTSSVIMTLVDVGRWDEAEQMLSELPDRRGEDVVAREQQLARTRLAIGRGRWDEARDRLGYLEGVLDRVVDAPRQQLRILDRAARFACWEGHYDDARAIVARARPLSEAPGCEEFMGRFVMYGLRAEADRATRARTSGDEELVLEATSAARGDLDALRRAAAVEGGDTAAGSLRATLATAEAEQTRLSGRADPTAWAVAADVWRLERVDLETLAYVLWRWSEAVLESGGPRVQAEAAAREAHDVASRLGAIPLIEAVEDLARRGRLDLGVPIEQTPVNEAVGLTRREREVLALVVEGMTNREIGEHLYIAEKTASVHVSNILAKLGVSGRTEAAAVAVRDGLVTSPLRQSGGEAITSRG